MAVTTTKEVTLKLLVNKDTNKVLFAEADNEFVNVLFSFLTLPLGTVARLVEKDSSMGSFTIGCLNSLYHCVEDLDEGCLGTYSSKEMLLQLTNLSEAYCRNLKLNIDDSNPTKYFICNNFPSCHEHDLSISFNKFKCRCGSLLNRSVLMRPFQNGFVKSGATFIITDDLNVMPNSMDITNFSLLQNMGIKSASSVTEMSVNVTKDKVLDLFKCSLFSKTPLTDLFLQKSKPSIERSIFFSFGFERPLDKDNFQISVKLVIRKSDNKLLYAQGEHDFANVILSFLVFPLGGVVSKFGGSFDTLYKGIADLDENKYFVSKKAKNRLVDPKMAPQYKYLSWNILPVEYDCYKCYYQLSKHIEGIGHNRICITDENITGEDNYEYMGLSNRTNATSNAGYVKGPSLYAVTDDLAITPFSPITLLNFITRFETPFEDLKEKVVTIGTKECLMILRAALTSTSALTNGLAHLLTEVKEEKHDEDN